MRYGDVTRRDILESCQIRSASIIVYVISDLTALRRSVRTARRLNPSVYIVVRSWRLSEIEGLQSIGANEVIAQEFEASTEIVTSVLTRLHIPSNIIRAQSKILRADGYQMLRTASPSTNISEKVALALASGATVTFLVSPEARAAGKSIKDLGLRQHTGATIIAVTRSHKSITNPSPEFEIDVGDLLILVGSHAQIEAAFQFLETTETS